MAHDKNRGFAGNRLDLLERGEDKDRSFTKTRFGLANYVGSKDCLRNASLLDCIG